MCAWAHARDVRVVRGWLGQPDVLADGVPGEERELGELKTRSCVAMRW